MTTNVSTGFVSRLMAGEGFAGIFLNGCIEVYTGDQPATADMAPTGTLVARITRNGGLWEEGSPSNGLAFVVGGRYATKEPSHLWKLQGLATGAAGWFRLRANAVDGGVLSTDAPRIDGRIVAVDTTPDAQMFVVDVNVTAVTSEAVPHWWLGIPPL